MADRDADTRLIDRFAELLEYPGTGVCEAARDCEALAARGASEAAALLREFRAFVEAAPLGRVQEIYSGTFDLDAAYHPYVGYHLFGETYKRSVFMLELKQRYRAHGFAVERDLPDHLAVLLRFVAHHRDSELADEILQEALVPALDRMTGKARSAGYEQEEPGEPGKVRSQELPYGSLLEALRLTLQRIPPAHERGIASVTDPVSASES
jgi:nitrate reductase delta subunit